MPDSAASGLLSPLPGMSSAVWYGGWLVIMQLWFLVMRSWQLSQLSGIMAVLAAVVVRQQQQLFGFSGYGSCGFSYHCCIDYTGCPHLGHWSHAHMGSIFDPHLRPPSVLQWASEGDFSIVRR